MITANASMYPMSWRRTEPASSPRSPRKFARAVGLAFVAAALGAAAATVVAAYDDQVAAQQLVTHSAVRAPLPTDLWARPVPPKPRVVVQYQYVAPRTQHVAPAAPTAAPMMAQPMTAQPMTTQPAMDPTAAPTAQPSYSPRPYHSPTPMPSASYYGGGGDD